MRRDQAGNRVQGRGLAAPVRAEQRNHAARRDFERHVGDPDQIAIENFEVLDLEQRRGHVTGPPINSIGVWPAAALAARVPRYAAITSGLLVTSRGEPRAISRPW